MKNHIHTVGDHSYNCYHWGDPNAEPVLFLHGFPEYGGAWDEVATIMSQKYHCIAPDLRGYGDSYAPADVAEYGVGVMIPDMIALINDLSGGEPINLVAHDWGAALAYVLAASASDRIAKFAVMNGVHPYPFANELAKGGAQSEASQYINYLRGADSTAEMEADDFSKLFSFMTKLSPGRDAWMTEAKKAEYRAAWGKKMDTMIHWYRASRLPVADPGKPMQAPELDPNRLRISMPHHIIWGTDDAALLPETRDGVIPLCDDVAVTELPGCDHWLHHQKPDEVARILLEFFS